MNRIFCIVICLSLFACGGGTEEEQYESLKTSLTYKAYKSAAQAGMKPLVNQVNKQLKNEDVQNTTNKKLDYDLKEEDGHLALGLLWAVAQKPVFAIAESNIALEHIGNEFGEYRALTILALGMYQKGWHNLGRTTSEKAKSVLGNKEMADQMYYEMLSSHLAFAMLNLQEGNEKGIHNSFVALADQTNTPWLPELGDAFASLRVGKIQDGLAKMKTLSEDARLNPKQQESLQQFIANIEKEFGDVDGELFNIKVLGKGLLEMIMKVDDSKFQALMTELESYKGKLDF